MTEMVPPVSASDEPALVDPSVVAPLANEVIAVSDASAPVTVSDPALICVAPCDNAEPSMVLPLVLIVVVVPVTGGLPMAGAVPEVSAPVTVSAVPLAVNVLAAVAEPRLIAPPVSTVLVPELAAPRTVIGAPVSVSEVPAIVEPRSVRPEVLIVIAVSALTAPVAVSVRAWMSVAPCDTETTVSGVPGTCGAVKLTAPPARIVVVVPLATVLPELALPVTVIESPPSFRLDPVVTVPSRIAPLPAVTVKSVATFV